MLSADAATVMTMPSTSQIAGDGRVAPLETTSAGSDVRMGNARTVLRKFSRSTSPRTTTRRSPKRDVDSRVEIEDDAQDIEERDMQLMEELRSAGVSYQYLNDEYSCLREGYARLYVESQEEFSQFDEMQ